MPSPLEVWSLNHWTTKEVWTRSHRGKTSGQLWEEGRERGKTGARDEEVQTTMHKISHKDIYCTVRDIDNIL